MNEAASYWLKLTGVFIVMGWVVVNSTRFVQVIKASSNVAVGAVTTLQQRNTGTP